MITKSNIEITPNYLKSDKIRKSLTYTASEVSMSRP